jgi:hypothetical protein
LFAYVLCWYKLIIILDFHHVNMFYTCALLLIWIPVIEAVKPKTGIENLFGDVVSGAVIATQVLCAQKIET